jgi:hypothetical protein
MVRLRVAPFFDVPILNGPDNVTFVRSPELKLHFILAVGVNILKQQVQPARMRLAALFVLQYEVTQAE